MTAYCRAPGVALARLGSDFAAYAPANGSSLLLNESSGELLLLLDDATPRTDAELMANLAAMYREPIENVAAAFEPVWARLLDAGLVRLQHGASSTL